jgi:hypothetical protein
MAVAKADGFATEDPLLTVVVAFSVRITVPVELIMLVESILAATERPACSSQVRKRRFIATARGRDRLNCVYSTHDSLPRGLPYIAVHGEAQTAGL